MKNQFDENKFIFHKNLLHLEKKTLAGAVILVADMPRRRAITTKNLGGEKVFF